MEIKEICLITFKDKIFEICSFTKKMELKIKYEEKNITQP